MKRFYKWYDELDGQDRFLLFLGMTFVGVVLLAFDNGIMRLLGAAYLVFMVVTRIKYKYDSRH